MEIIELRSVAPLDWEVAIRRDVKAGRLIVVDPAPRMCGVASEVVDIVCDKALFSRPKRPVVPPYNTRHSSSLRHGVRTSPLSCGSGNYAAIRRMISNG